MAALSFCQSLVQRPLLHFHVPSKPNNSHHLSIRCSSSSPFNDKTSVTLKTENRNNNKPLVCRYGGGGQESKNYVEAFAVGRNIRMSADKARRVIDQIRGRPYEETLMILELMPYRACEDIIRIVFSAAANASHNLGLNKSSLIVSGAQVDVGPTLKRIRFLNKGRVGRIKKRTCQITIRVKGLANESEVVANPV